MGIISWIKSSVVIKLLFGYIYLVSGTIISFLMLLGVVIWPFNKGLYRRYVHWLAYTVWCEFTFLGDWWANADAEVYADAKDLQCLGREHMLVIVNHTYEIDWLMAWMMSERLGGLGSTKIYGKVILKFIPVMGWMWYFTESIFLKRDWTKDRKILEKSIKEIISYPENLFVILLLHAEGTRWTPEKHKASLKVAREKGYPIYKRMLLPRTKGFAHSVELMKGKEFSILDLTVGFPEPEPSLMDTLNGKNIRCAMKARRIPISEVPAETEEETSNWLRELYKQKDEDLDTYLRTGKFEGAPLCTPPRRLYNLLWFFIWLTVTCIPLVKYVMYLATAASSIHQVIAVTGGLLLVFLMKWMISFTEIKHGTSYGLQKAGTKKAAKVE